VLLLVAAGGCAQSKVPAETVDPPSVSEEYRQFPVFFEGLKKAVAEKWDPQAALKRHPALWPEASRSNRHVLLSITLDAEGVLRDIQVKESSGVQILDAAAVAAFQKAQPFVTPPPPALLVKDGTVRFEFGFLMDFGRGNPPPVK
jgi:TonB family protein